MFHSPNNVITVHAMDEYAVKHLFATLKLTDVPELPTGYRGDIRCIRECVTNETGKVWELTVFTQGEQSAGSAEWVLHHRTTFATVCDDPTEIFNINVMARKFKAIAKAYAALDWHVKPSSVYLIANRVAQLVHDNPKLEIVDYITNEMFQDEECTEVETIGMLEVLGAQYQDIRRVDTVVISRSVRVGIEHDHEILCCWPVVVCNNKLSFNQYIPGPVISMGNLARHHKVIDMNTKDIRWACSAQFEIVQEDKAAGTATLKKYHAESDTWVTYDCGFAGIRPIYTDNQVESVGAEANDEPFVAVH